MSGPLTILGLDERRQIDGSGSPETMCDAVLAAFRSGDLLVAG